MAEHVAAAAAGAAALLPCSVCFEETPASCSGTWLCGHHTCEDCSRVCPYLSMQSTLDLDRSPGLLRCLLCHFENEHHVRTSGRPDIHCTLSLWQAGPHHSVHNTA